uniref:Sulfotransferase domain-containing protein n=1 Tax=Strongyloides stercoralis TaxID=6248 RepID=A0AAF5DKU8_STRER
FSFITFILPYLLSNALEENKINSTNITNNYFKYFHPIPIINETFSKKNVKLFFIPRLKLGACFIGKTGSIIQKMIFCYLKKKKNEKNFKSFTLCNMNGKTFDNLENFEKIYGVEKVK